MPGGDAIPYILATAGHVDHGKSALVRALTGTDPDRLPEEKARGLTIELGFASFRLPAPAGADRPSHHPGGTGVPPVLFPQGHGRDARATKGRSGSDSTSPGANELEIGLIDVPGHEDFVRNMVAGVGSIDAALLVVAADDGWMPQTEEHFRILAHLGVARGVVALSKIDLAADESVSISAVRDRLRGTPFQEASIVPTSVVSGRGIEELKLALASLLAATPPQPDLGTPRLPVDRVFIVKGVGTVVTGTLTGGTLQRGQPVIVQPSGTGARIRAVQTYSREVEIARPGSRVALNLPDLHPAPRRGARPAKSIARGDVITIASVGAASSRLDVLMNLDTAIRDNTIVQVHLGTAAVGARIQFFEPTSGHLARLALNDPIFALAGDRFIIRDWSEQQTLGGSVVLDSNPPLSIRRRSSARSRQIVLLEARAASPDDADVFVATQQKRDRVMPRLAVLQSSRFSVAQIDAAVSHLAGKGLITAIGDWLVESTLLAELRDRITAAVDAHHHSHPEQLGFPLAEARAIVAAAQIQNTEPSISILVDAVIRELSRSGFERTGTIVRRASHRPALPPRLQAAGAALRRQLALRPLDPPSIGQLAPTDLAQQAIRFLIATGEAIALNKELVLLADAYQKAVDVIRERISSSGPATVSELKTVLGTSRRVMVPLLEKLDRDGITVRQGDYRRLPQG